MHPYAERFYYHLAENKPMAHLSRFSARVSRVILESMAAVAVAALAAGYCAAQPSVATPQSSPATSTPSPVTPQESKISKLEEQLAELGKKLEKPPKDSWDKLSILSGFISGVLVAFIGAFVTVMYQRREARLKEEQNTRDDKDRKEKLRLEGLRLRAEDEQQKTAISNKLKELEIAQTQLKISQTQTVRDLLRYLQSEHEQNKQAALTLIAFQGNAELAAELSRLYKTESELIPVLRNIASQPGTKSELRRQAATALGRLGTKEEKDEAARKLVELSDEAKQGAGERLSIAADLEGMGETEKSAEIHLQLAADPNVGADERGRAVEALKRLDYTEKARESLAATASDERAEAKKRLAAIITLGQLDGAQEEAPRWANILAEMIRAPQTTSADMKEISKAFGQLGDREEAARALLEVGSDPGVDIVKRYQALEIITAFGAGAYTQPAAEKRKELSRQIAHDPQADPALRLTAVRETMDTESKEEVATVLREIIDAPGAKFFTRATAVSLLEAAGYAEEAKKSRIEIVAKSPVGRWVSRLFSKKTEPAKTETAEPPGKP